MTCLFCGGAAHPATGAQYTPTAVACRACVVSFWTWFRAQQHKKWGGSFFYEHAAAKVSPSQGDIAKTQQENR